MRKTKKRSTCTRAGTATHELRSCVLHVRQISSRTPAGPHRVCTQTPRALRTRSLGPSCGSLVLRFCSGRRDGNVCRAQRRERGVLALMLTAPPAGAPRPPGHEPLFRPRRAPPLPLVGDSVFGKIPKREFWPRRFLRNLGTFSREKPFSAEKVFFSSLVAKKFLLRGNVFIKKSAPFSPPF
jgi:hypothetical protein